MYGKFFSSTFTGSMYGLGTDVFAVWGYVIANTVDSRIELNPQMLASVLGSTENKVVAAIEILCLHDKKSRNKTEDGRRLIREGQFQYRVTNHEIYRSIRNEEDRRAYNRQKQQESRARRLVKRCVIDKPLVSTMSAHTEAEAEAEADTKRTTLSDLQSDGAHLKEKTTKKKLAKQQAREVLQFLNEKTGHNYRSVDTNLKPIETKLKSGVSMQDCKTVIARQTREWKNDEKMSKFLRPKTLFAAANFESYLGQCHE